MFKVKVVISILLFALFYLGATSGKAHSNYLNSRLSIQVKEKPLGVALKKLEEKGHFSFSYNADHIPSDSIVSFTHTEQTLASILERLLGSTIGFKESGRHIILIREFPVLTKQTKRKKNYIVKGIITDAISGNKIANASVYEVGKGYAVLTNADGHFVITVNRAVEEYISLTFSRREYKDTVIISKAGPETYLEIELQPKAPEMTSIEPRTVEVIPNPLLDTIRLVKLLVGVENLEQSRNLPEVFERKVAQISFLPILGSNGRLSGLTVNTFSFNLIAGYAHGLDGVELGTVNLIRGNMNGFQVGGIGNVIGGKTNGLQIGGFFNLNVGKVNGFQISGFSNTVLDTFKGVQLTGFSNVAKGEMDGHQLSGFSNIALSNLEGSQWAGFSNVAIGNMNGVQLSGFSNYAENMNTLQLSGFLNIAKGKVNGFQIAGFSNVAKGKVNGFQIAGFSNTAKQLKKVQIASFANWVKKDMNGLQLSSFLNYAKHVKGVQIGIVNLSDTMQGLPIGLFSFSKSGYHHFDVGISGAHLLNVDFKTGIQQFYNIFSGAMAIRDQKITFDLGYGFGGELGKKKGRLGIEVIAYQELDSKFGFVFEEYDVLLSTRLAYSYPISERVRMVAGPVLQTQFTNQINTDTGIEIRSLAPYSLFASRKSGDVSVSWLGARLGFRF